jgi:hypothetical protein
MGRPPLGERALTPAEKMRRYRERKFGNRPPRHAEAAREIAQLKARIAELETALAQEREKRRPPGPVRIASPATHAATQSSGPNAQIAKFIRHLGNANQTEAAMAAQGLVTRLTANESDRHALADLWEKHCKEQAVQRPKRKPVDWSAVERAINAYAEGKTRVTINKLVKAVRAQEPSLEDHGDSANTYQFFKRRLGRLGFTASSSGLTFERLTS